MQLGKIVSIACLTYIVYGVTSAFQLGSFLPPIPIKPFLYLCFVVLGLITAIRTKVTFLSYVLLGWVALYALNIHSFLEAVLTTEYMLLYEQRIMLYVALVVILIFTAYSLTFVLGLSKVDKRLSVLFFPLVGAILLHFMNSDMLSFQAILIGWALLVFIADRFYEERTPHLFRLSSIIYGVGVIETVELISLYI